MKPQIGIEHQSILTSRCLTAHNLFMRTTLQIEDDVYRAAKSIAAMENKSIGAVVSHLIRKALAPGNYAEETGDIPSFRVSETAPPLTMEMVRAAEEDSQ